MAETTAATAPFPISMEAFSRLAPRQKVIGMVGVALLLAVLIGGWLWAKDPPYAVLFAIQDEKDGGQIVAALSAAEHSLSFQRWRPHHPGTAGCGARHPAEARRPGPAQGRPGRLRADGNQKLGISQFAEQVNYQRALEGELARSIQSLAAGQGRPRASGDPQADRLPARRPEGLGLGAGQPAPRPQPGANQVAGIVNLVVQRAAAAAANVSVVDQDGKLISQQATRCATPASTPRS
jgi:flagellar M-ring protein FliF